MRTVIVMLSLLAATTAHGATRVATVPSRFVGEWNMETKACGTALNDSRLKIGRNTLTGYESSGPILAVVIEGTREIALISQLKGEGQTWLSLSHFRLDAAGKKLTDVTNEATPVVRYRCLPK